MMKNGNKKILATFYMGNAILRIVGSLAFLFIVGAYFDLPWYLIFPLFVVIVVFFFYDVGMTFIMKDYMRLLKKEKEKK